MTDHPTLKSHIPADYAERVYAGVLGKLIGVYLGRPFEQWSHERIMAELGEITGYVNEKRGVPLIVTDDDITGTFTFLRALPDHGNLRDLTPSQIDRTWLNYIIENKSILWWGGFGYSTEHTAYLRLKSGIEAPESGSSALNGTTVAEQIGAQIFIDGWAMVAPGDPAFAADLARRAGSVSHDGEAVYAAQLWAAMEAAAFIEADLTKLIDVGLSYIPQDCLVRRLINDLREWRAVEPDWREARRRLAAKYGYDKFPGACHVIPNRGVMILGLLYCEDDFSKALSIVNTCGWDTDCNSGNVGCLLGIKNGLAGIEARWRDPVADRLYMPTADGGRVITDAVQETYHIIASGRALADLPPEHPKNDVRFHFSLRGSVQGFQVESSSAFHIQNTFNEVTQSRCLTLHYVLDGKYPVRCHTATFIPPDALSMSGSYALMASPTLYSGQSVRARVIAAETNTTPLTCNLYISTYAERDHLFQTMGPAAELTPGIEHIFNWIIPDLGGATIAQIGLELSASQPTEGTLYLDYLDWTGSPHVTFDRAPGTLWKRAWIEGVSRVRDTEQSPFHIVQNEGTGLLITGTREWQDYNVAATLTPHLCSAAGIAARVQGMTRYYALLLVSGGKIRLVKAFEDVYQTLAEAPCEWRFEQPISLSLQVEGNTLRAWVDDQVAFTVTDTNATLENGGIALVVEQGCLEAGAVIVS